MTDPFTVLAEPARRRILEVLASGERAAGELADALRSEFGISQPAVSQHLKVLRDHGFTRVRAEGTRRIYALDTAALDAADAWLDQVRGFWGERLEDLAEEVARGRKRRTVAAPVLGPIERVTVQVVDLGRMEAWYRDVLGLRQLGSVDGQVAFDAGGVRLLLVGGAAPTDVTADAAPDADPLTARPLLWFRVTDVDATYQTLSSRGVHFRRAPRTELHGEGGAEERVAVLDDPEGRPLGITAKL